MDASAVLSGVLGVLTLVSVVASAVAVARATLAKTTIDSLKESNDALQTQVGLLKESSVAQAVQIAALTSENAALQTYVSGTDAVAELARTMAKADAGRAAEHHDIMAAIQTVPLIVTSHHDEVMALIRASIHTHSSAA